MAHNHMKKDGNRSRLLAAFSVTAVFMLAEVAGGLLSGSLALLADAGHMLTDAAALLIALLATHFARRRPSGHHSFGLLRLTTLAAFVNAIALLAITVLIVWEAVQRFWHPQPIAGGMMLVIAIGGLLANLLSFWLLHHGSGEKNLNVRAAALHGSGRSARFRWSDCRRAGYFVYRLDPDRPDTLYPGFSAGIAKRLEAD